MFNDIQQIAPHNAQPAFLPAKDLLKPVPVHYLIDELIEEKSLSMLFALPGMGKSFLAIDWAASISTGTPWLGREVKQGPVFYLAGEGHAGLKRRLRAWELANGVSLEKAPLFVSSTAGGLLSRESVEILVNQIESLVEAHGMPALIIIDTYARNMGGGDENSNSDAGIVVKHVDAMRQHLDCGTLIVHHTGHGDNGRPRGASALPAAMDSIFRLDGKHRDGVLVDLKLVHIKSKESELVPDMHFKIEQVELTGWLDTKGRTMNSAIIVPRAPDIAGLLDEIPASSDAALRAYVAAAKTKGSMTDEGRFLGLELENWRDAAYAINSTATPDAKKKSFQRARADLIERGMIVEIDDLFRLSGSACKFEVEIISSLLSNTGAASVSHQCVAEEFTD